MNLPRHSAVTPKAAAHVLWHYGHDSGLRPGSFVRNLLCAIAAADSANAALLALGFGPYVAAIELAERHEDGIEQLEKTAATLHAREQPSSGDGSVRGSIR